MMLKIGDKIPPFSAIDHKGNNFNCLSFIGNKPLVIYFYPKDNTLGCTAQACSFRDQYQDFKELGAEVIGISSDDKASHEKFIQKYNLPFILLSDSDHAIKKLFGVKPSLFGLIPGRVTFVADEMGVIQLIFDSQFVFNHIPKALEMIKKITKKIE